MSTISRELPHSIEAEETLLSMILLDGEEMLDRCMAAGIWATTFYVGAHGIVYDCALSLKAAQKPVDVSVLAEELKATKRLEEVGSYAFLTRISSRISTTAQAAFFIDRVKELHRLREIIKQATAIVEMAYNYTGQMMETFAPPIEKLAGILQDQQTTRTWSEAVKEAEAVTRERMKPVADRQTSSMELSWGIPDFDRFFQPIEPGELIIIGGYTSSGKSSLLRQVMWAIARAGHPALLETIEVRDAEEAINLAGHIAGIRSRARLHELHHKDQEQLLDAFKQMRVPHFSVCDQDHDMTSMVARARAFKRRHGLKAFGADYLQIMRDVKDLRANVRPDFAIGCVTSEFKRFATRENVACFLLSGFNREYIRAGNREPKLSDLDGSASIEKDASRVILIDVPTEYILRGAKYTQSPTADAVDQPTFYVKAIQAKGRNQGTASVGLMFHRETKTFRQIAR
jgi:replicative DNA helicase